MAASKFPLRKNRMTGKVTSMKTHPNVKGAEHILLTEQGHKLRDLIAYTLRMQRQQRKPGMPIHYSNSIILHKLNGERAKYAAVGAVTSNPFRRSIKRAAEKVRSEK